MKKYNHAYSIGFSIDSDDPTGESDTAQMLLDGLQARLDELKSSNNEIIEACGAPFDTYENEESKKDE